MILCRYLSNILRLKYVRTLSYKYSNSTPSKVVRQQFLDFFIKENNYGFVRSSPVVPFHDATVPFVNAGMNQFKGIFLGKHEAKLKYVANTQKCIRVGGKHNDLDVVGTDGYHHTFFEMLGNWSFGECSKIDSCKLAWELLTKIYKIPKYALYVTYFGGDETLRLDPDLECKQVWRELGVPESHILPFGVKDNFWEMGITGPCGPCTEIHYDHGGVGNRAEFVNKGLHELVEIWNIVFIEYNRDVDGNIVPLPHKHVDTGMGFERLVAILQGKTCNYDTDIFKVLFNALEKNCSDVPKYKNHFGENDWNHLHTNYRILADHSRMITACLGDGMIPEQNPKLRKIMRRVFSISENTFKRKTGIMKELSNYVIETLGPVYPEMEINSKQIHQIIDYEEDVYHSLRNQATSEWSKILKEVPSLENLDIIEMPGLIYAYKEIKDSNIDEITPDIAFKFYDTYGLDEEGITKLCRAMKLNYDENHLKHKLDNIKLRSKQLNITNSFNIDLHSLDGKTDDSLKYCYDIKADKYIFNNAQVKIKYIVKENELVEAVPPNTECDLILNRTNLYSESGGQDCDIGHIYFNSGKFEIYGVKNVDEYVLHTGIFKSQSNLRVDEEGVSQFNESVRLGNMRNHTATHILNAIIKDMKGATCQKSSKVTDRFLNLDVGIFSNKLTIEDIANIEDRVNRIIEDAAEVKSLNIDSHSLMSLDKVTLIPGEIYPENGIRLIEIHSRGNVLSREPCCGTHVLNTKDIGKFCIISFKSLGRSTVSINAVTGERAELALNNGQELLDDVINLQKNVKEYIEQPEVLEIAVGALKRRFTFDIHDDNIVPVTTRQQAAEKLLNITKQIKESVRNSLKKFIEMEMQSVLQTGTLTSEKDKKYIVHYLRTSMILENVPLQKATQICYNLPVLIVSFSNNSVKARCCVPESLVNNEFDAEKWLRIVGEIFNSPVVPPKGQDSAHVCIMKSKKVSISDWHILLTDSLDAAKYFALKNL